MHLVGDATGGITGLVANGGHYDAHWYDVSGRGGPLVVADVTMPRTGKVNDGQVRLDVSVGGLRDFTVIHLRSPGDKFWTVMAFPSSGKVKVFDGYQEEAP